MYSLSLSQRFDDVYKQNYFKIQLHYLEIILLLSSYSADPELSY